MQFSGKFKLKHAAKDKGTQDFRGDEVVALQSDCKICKEAAAFKAVWSELTAHGKKSAISCTVGLFILMEKEKIWNNWEDLQNSLFSALIKFQITSECTDTCVFQMTKHFVGVDTIMGLSKEDEVQRRNDQESRAWAGCGHL